MGFRKVIVNEAEKCPCCGGKSGLRYQVRVHVSCALRWGSSEPEPEIKETQEYLYAAKHPQTAVCINCGKRVEFEING